jgi:hypothetical protein
MDCQHQNVDPVGIVNRASSALIVLRSLPVKNVEQANVCITLGLLAATFHYAEYGSNPPLLRVIA